MFACLYRPPHGDAIGARLVRQRSQSDGGRLQPSDDVLAAIAAEFSPRYELHRSVPRVPEEKEREASAERLHATAHDAVVIDISGLERLFGTTQRIGEELRRTAASRGVHVHAAIAGTQTAAMILARAQPGLTVIARDEEPDRLSPLPIGILVKVALPVSTFGPQPVLDVDMLDTLKRWGLRTLGDLAALPPADLVARLGRPAWAWQAQARGEDVRPLIPTLDEERFESTLELEWPIDGLEPLSFVLTRLLEPLSTRLERRDRGAAVLHVRLGLVTRATDGTGLRDVHARRLELPTPMRDVRSLRTLALLDLESHPPAAPVDRVTIVIDPTPGRVLQHRLFTRAHPAPEQISTLVARLNALMGQDRVGAPVTVDTYRPGMFTMRPFAAEHSHEETPSRSVTVVTSVLRRCRQPVPARVAVGADARPVRVTTDRRGFGGGAVVNCAGPWRSSGDWWTASPTDPSHPTDSTHPTHPTHPTHVTHPTHPTFWDCDEWDVALSDGATYRLFRDRARDAWFIEAIVD
jgi:protein ImuB